MPDNVDLYDTSYGNAAFDVYSDVRLKTYGKDFGQTSWASLEEFAEIPRLLKIDASSNVLEIGCGSGGCALHFVEIIDCRITGIDVNAHGIRAADHLAHDQQLADRAHFIVQSAAERLPFSDETFDAAYSNDAFCHIPNRPALLRECRRVLKPGGRLLFSDALVISGPVTNEELSARSSIGYYIFVPRGENERLIGEAGFTLIEARDTTAQAAAISQRWHDARAGRTDAFVQIEGETKFDGLQRFLSCVHTLTSENRLARFVYVAAK
jgi:SAM-dependent methyltransferase